MCAAHLELLKRRIFEEVNLNTLSLELDISLLPSYTLLERRYNPNH